MLIFVGVIFILYMVGFGRVVGWLFLLILGGVVSAVAFTSIMAVGIAVNELLL